MRQLPLRLFQRIVFVDWHGVLSRDLFWTSILTRGTHPLRPQLEAKLGEIFARRSLTHDWMKGIMSSRDVISQMDIRMDRRFHQDYLVRRLVADCINMHVNAAMVELLCRIKPLAVIVLATDNMDCFVEAFDQVRLRRRHRLSPSAYSTMPEWATLCDDIICSSNVGVLKAEDPGDFFGPLLSEYGLTFADALLIDDRADNCEAFRLQGGSAAQWVMGTNDIDTLIEATRHWLESAP